jgi:hypothetical protein
MARTPTLAPASRIRIEDEVWEEAFASRVPATGRSARPRAAVPRVRADAVSEVRPSAISPVRASPPEGARRTIRIQGRGADRYYSSSLDRPRPVSLTGRMTSSPDRLAMWATLLGFLLVLVALLSSHF